MSLAIVLEVIKTLVLVIYYSLEALVLCFIPAKYRHKNVAHERVLITGAGMGIGRLMAIKFGKLGSKLVLWDINQEALDSTKQELEDMKCEVHTYVVDLSNREQVYETAEKTKKEVGDIDILINNAGIVSGKKIHEVSDDLMEKTMYVNAISHFWTVRAFLPKMMEMNHGHIVTIASSAGLFGVNGLVDYCASKFAAVGFDESLTYELLKLGADGVKTTVVCPYFMSTGMFEGAKTRFNFLLPIVEPEAAVERIMDGILTNEKRVCIPVIVRFLYLLKGILPHKAQFIAGEFLGAHDTMKEFNNKRR